ncbi:MAG: hypothetical protein KatS3mg095_0164 [Candidatus Parcubacteria bacterium]|nr:MAG: hypothetical protein KatS3mg095_0164 [Candidatus Parcubacteria bacterium]
MIILFISILDVLLKTFLNKLIFLGLIFTLIYLLNNKNFILPYFVFSIVNDLIMILPLGFTGFYFGIVLILLTFFNRFAFFEKEINLYIILGFSVILIFIFSWYYYFGFNINLLFFILLIINLLIAIIFNFLTINL